MRLPEQTRPVIRVTAPVARVTGLGDVVKGVTTRLGFTPCGACEKRAETLNRWVAFTPRETG